MNLILLENSSDNPNEAFSTRAIGSGAFERESAVFERDSYLKEIFVIIVIKGGFNIEGGV